MKNSRRLALLLSLALFATPIATASAQSYAPQPATGVGPWSGGQHGDRLERLRDAELRRRAAEVRYFEADAQYHRLSDELARGEQGLGAIAADLARLDQLCREALAAYDDAVAQISRFQHREAAIGREMAQSRDRIDAYRRRLQAHTGAVVAPGDANRYPHLAIEDRPDRGRGRARGQNRQGHDRQSNDRQGHDRQDGGLDRWREAIRVEAQRLGELGRELNQVRRDLAECRAAAARSGRDVQLLKRDVERRRVDYAECEASLADLSHRLEHLGHDRAAAAAELSAAERELDFLRRPDRDQRRERHGRRDGRHLLGQVVRGIFGR